MTETSFHDGVFGRVRCRSLGTPRPGVPELVLVHGMTACDYMVPGLRVLAGWTRAHLLDLPGCGGSGDPPHELTVAEYAEAVTGWIDHRGPPAVMLVGHSSGTHVATETALRRPGVVTGVVLASPVFDPAYGTLPHTLFRWALDLTREPRSLERLNRPERKRAGFRRLLHVLHEHRRYDLPAAITRLTVPVLVIRARDDALSTRRWVRSLAENVAEVPGPHTFTWVHPEAWSPPIRELAVRTAAHG